MSSTPVKLGPNFCAERLGVARLTRMAFAGVDLKPLWHEMMEKVTDDAAGAGLGLDLSILAQLLGDKATGLAIQAEVLGYQQLFRSPAESNAPRLRLLALAAATDIGGNTPIEFLLSGSDIELTTLYVVPGKPLPDPIPDHDIAMVVVCDAKDTRATLEEIEKLTANWPRPVINRPRRLALLDRDKLYPLLRGLPGLCIPMTARVSRACLDDLEGDAIALREILEDGAWPLIIRPVDSHAGVGLAKLEDEHALGLYLEERPEDEFFLSRYVDYASDDGQFRKYRIVIVGDKTFAVHMAISDQWKIWYLNADMTESPRKRDEEAMFMQYYDAGFAARHARALSEITSRLGLDYVTIDCAETRDGELLVFEADSAAIVHDMDPPKIFPYKAPQMRKIFDAFTAMLHARAIAARPAAHAAA
jgi:hypothetical protein